jgi:hypothetical protein
MGSPLSPILADIYMGFLESRFVTGLNSDLFLWKRYVDDTFVIWLSTKRRLQMFRNQLNTSLSAPTIKFTLEIEKDQKLPFLDVLILRDGDGKSISFAVYRKATHSGRFLNFASCHPISVKAGVVKSLFLRAGKLCSPEHFAAEQRELTKMFTNSGYPKKFIEKNKSQIAKLLPKREQPLGICVLPFVPTTTPKIGSVLKKYNIRSVFRPGPSLRRILSSERPMRESGETTNAIYEIPCTECDEVYIGETKRRVHTRLKEHCKRSDSAVHQHMVTNGHEINFDSFRIRAQNSNTYERRIKEALFISRANCFNGCGGYELSPIWSDLQL